jgi:hypothetical protein
MVHDTSAPIAHRTPPSEPGLDACSDCQPMQINPAALSSRDGSSCANGTASRSRLPITVTAIGSMPMMSEVIAMPPDCTACASRTK